MKHEFLKSEIINKLGNFIKVCPITSPRSGESVRNQYELKFENGYAFQSYNRLIGIKVGGRLYLTEDHTYSTTTSKWTTEWCGYDSKERKRGLENGNIGLLVDSIEPEFVPPTEKEKLAQQTMFND